MRAFLATALLLAACAPELPLRCEKDADCAAGACVDGFCSVPPPQIESFSATPATITVGQRTKLTVDYAFGKGSLDHDLGPIESGLSVTVAPRESTTYLLTVQNSAWPAATRSLTVEVLPAPAIASFTAAPQIVTAGQSASLSAEYAGGAGAVDHDVGELSSGQALAVLPAATTTYLLSVTSPTGSKIQKSVTVTVVPPAAIESFAPESPALTLGGATSLVALFQGGTGRIDKGVGEIQPGGAARVTPPLGSTTYVLTVINPAGDAVSDAATVVVHPPASIASFTATPAAIYKAQGNATLQAAFTGGTGTIDNGVGAVTSGQTRTVSPTATTVYTLTVTNPAGDPVTAQRAVTVYTQPMSITRFSANPPEARFGDKVFLDWVLDGVPTQLSLNGADAMTAIVPYAVRPVRHATYTLFAHNPLGDATSTIVVDARGLELFAGHIGGPGTLDSPGPAARFNGPAHADFDGATNLYVADSLNHTIRVINARGQVGLRAGVPGEAGTDDFPVARFKNPRGLAVDRAGNVYVADTGNHTIRKISGGGVATIAGKPGVSGHADGVGDAASFNSPYDVALDAATNIYVADTFNFSVRKIDKQGRVSTVAGLWSQSGTTDGSTSAARFRSLQGIEVDSAGAIWLADASTSGSTIRKIAGGTVSTVAGSATVLGATNATGTSARFRSPFGLAFDAANNLYIADSGNHTIRRMTPAAVVTTWTGAAGSPGFADGSTAAARFAWPIGLAVDDGGSVWVSDAGSAGGAIRRISPARQTMTLAGLPASATASAEGIDARFSAPSDLVSDSAGNLYVADALNHTIRKITPAGSVSTLAGSAGQSGTTNATGSSARFNLPSSVALYGSDLYVADKGNHTIRKITLPGAVVSLVAGVASSAGSTNGTAATAKFSSPTGVVVDSSGKIFVADSGNGSIRKIQSGSVSTFASGFTELSGIGIDAANNLYLPNGHCISRISSGAVVSTFAGACASAGWADAGAPLEARFSSPGEIALAPGGEMFVADRGNNAVRKISAAGQVSTVAGGGKWSSGTFLGPLPGSLAAPPSMIANSAGDLLIISGNAILLLTAP